VRFARLSFLGLLLCGSCFLGLGRGLWTPDEPREAGISRDMSDRPGMIPTLNGQPFVEKPPLYYWATAMSLRLAGGPEIAAARAVSGLAALLTLALLFLWASRSASTGTAAVATVILATAAAFAKSAHMLRMDALLLLFCTLAVWSAWERIGRAGGPWFLASFYAGLVLALWTKGLIGPVLVLAGLATYAALSRSVLVLAPLRPVAGAVVLLSAFSSLALAIAASGGGEALRTWFYVNHVARFVHPVATGHEHTILYYVWTLPLAIAPWLVSFLALIRPHAPVFRRDRADAVLVRYAAAMTVGPLLVLTASSSKREVYLLPLLPALSLLMAIVTRDRIESERGSPRPGGWTRAGDWTQAAILGLVGIAPWAAHLVVTGRVTPWSAILGIAGLAAAWELGRAVLRRDAERAFWIGAASMGVALAGVFTLLVPQVDAVKNFEPFLVSIDSELPRGEPVPAMGADETLLGIVPFVTGRRVIPIEAKDLPHAPFVLVQSLDGSGSPGPLDAAYERVAARDFGPGRRMALWRRRDLAR
jgi:4-amino-4-deoxy-L-arabinose transferase-like glycosyltransferase